MAWPGALALLVVLGACGGSADATSATLAVPAATEPAATETPPTETPVPTVAPTATVAAEEAPTATPTVEVESGPRPKCSDLGLAMNLAPGGADAARAFQSASAPSPSGVETALDALIAINDEEEPPVTYREAIDTLRSYYESACELEFQTDFGLEEASVDDAAIGCEAAIEPMPNIEYEVVNIAADDPDGGLVGRTDEGVDAPVVRVLPAGTRVTTPVDVDVCRVGTDDKVRWRVIPLDAIGGDLWVNAFFLEAALIDATAAFDGDVSPAGATSACEETIVPTAGQEYEIIEGGGASWVDVGDGWNEVDELAVGSMVSAAGGADSCRANGAGSVWYLVAPVQPANLRWMDAGFLTAVGGAPVEATEDIASTIEAVNDFDPDLALYNCAVLGYNDACDALVQYDLPTDPGNSYLQAADSSLANDCVYGDNLACITLGDRGVIIDDIHADQVYGAMTEREAECRRGSQRACALFNTSAAPWP